ncbi:MAG: hypothetical protein J5I90_18950 [Caldilineales bacterium]|nr:hypothetical protein [Caldilineales bacterium]
MKRLWFTIAATVLLAMTFVGFVMRQNPASAAAMEIAGQFGGAVYDAAATEDYAFIGVGPRLLVLDVSAPGQPRKVGQTKIMAGVVRSVALVDKHIYVGAGAGGLHIVDVSDPAQPVIVGIHETGGYVEDVAVQGNLVYVASSPVWDGSQWTGDSLQIVDTADPAAPKLLATYETPGWEFGVAAAQSSVYVADGDGGLRVLDASDPAKPVEVGAYDTPGVAMAVAVEGTMAYVADFTEGLRVVDVSDAREPREVGFAELPGRARDVTLAGEYAYVSSDEAGLHIVDISNPAAPQLVGVFDESGDVRGAAIVDEIVYVADRSSGMRVANIKDKASPVQMGGFDTLGYVNGVAVAGDLETGLTLYTASGGDVKVVDMAEIDTPFVTTSLVTPGDARDIAVQMQGREARQLFVADSPVWNGQDWAGGGLRILDLAGSGEMREITFLDTPGQALGVEMAQPFVYLADGHNGLRVYNAANPGQLQETKFHDISGHTRDIALSNGYAYIANAGQGVRVEGADLPDPAQPLARSEIALYAHGLSASNKNLYVVDAIEPGDPVLTGKRGFENGLRILDIGNPSELVEAGMAETPGDIQNAAAGEDVIVVADGDGGLLLFRLIP